MQSHTIWYRPATNDDAAGSAETASSPKKTRSEKCGKASPKAKKDELWTGEYLVHPHSKEVK